MILARALTSLALSGLLLLGGCGGSGGDGPSVGSGIPTATNAAITPPPNDPVAITTGDQSTNTTIAAATFQSLDGAGMQTFGASPGVTGIHTSSTAQTRHLTVGDAVRRHAEKIADHSASAGVTGAQIVQTVPCLVSGTSTVVFDDVSGDASEIFVNCDQGGVVFHGAVSSSNVSVTGANGGTPGGAYNITISGTISIDLKVTVTSTIPNDVLLTQAAFTFSVQLSGTWGADGVTPNPPTRVVVTIAGSSLLASNGVHREQLSNFSLTFIEDDSSGTSISGSFTYASTAIGGSVTVNIISPVVYPAGAIRPNAGVFEIVGSSGKIRVTFAASAPVVTVQVYDAGGTNVIDTHTYNSWDEFDVFAP